MLIQKGVNNEYVDSYLKKRQEEEAEDFKDMKKILSSYQIDIKGKTVLDLPGGPGIDTKMFCILGADRVIYQDKYIEYIETAKKVNKEYLDKIEFHKGDINAIDYIKDNSIDFAFSNVSFFYSYNDVGLLRKLIKKIKKGGFLYIITLDINKFNNLPTQQKIFFALFHMIYKITNYKIITLPYNNMNKLRNVAKKKGLEEVYYHQPNRHYGKGDAWTGATYVLRQKK